MSADIVGNLVAMDLPTLVQFATQRESQTLIHLEQDGYTGLIYLDGGKVHHAELRGPDGDLTTIGEEVVYELLSWESGEFKVSRQPPPTTSIELDWSFLLMEGLRRIDEQRQHLVPEDSDELLLDMLADMSAEDAATIKELLKQQKYKEFDMASVDQTLHAIMNIEGAIATALVDWDSGLTLGTAGSGIDIDLAAAGNTNVVRAKLAVMKDLGLKGGIEDILITLTGQYHLIRILHDSKASLFLYVVLDRNHSNLGMARHKLAAIESDLNV